MKLTVCLLMGMVMALTLHAKGEQDFVGLLVDELTENAEAVSEEYDCVTVSPAMMEKMLQLMQSKDLKDEEQIQRALQHIKSMRIFTANKHIDKYYEQTMKLLRKKSKSYKPFKADAKDAKKPCVWVRRNGNNVVEMIVLNRKEEQSFHIVNLTGDMSKTFVDELLKM